MLQCSKDIYIIIYHEEIGDEWVTLSAANLSPKTVAHEPLINYGGRLEVGVGKEGGSGNKVEK